MFVDAAQICAQGGNGGAGCASFHKEAHKAHGGPDGGDGGRGGDVLVVADPSVATLVRFTKEIHFRAESGTHGSSRQRHGRRGDDLAVRVPPGTTLRTLDGDLVADLVRPGDRVVVAGGGRGGRGNARFVSRARRAPGFAEQGEFGEERWLRLELRLMADVALVGFPNAGKSTLISVVSAARPKIADYPFTTLTPNLGVATVGDTEVVVADIPGLIQGAAEGRGLGHQFLRHVERARVLLLLLDPLSPEASASEQEAVLLEELCRFRPELLDRPRVAAVNKMDAVTAEDAAALREAFPGAHLVSGASRAGVPELMGALARLVDDARRCEPEAAGFVVHRPRLAGVTVSRHGHAWVVQGDAAQRAVAVADLTNPEALAYVQQRLRRLGVDDALVAAGCRSGDEVRIGELVFDYESEGSAGGAGSEGSEGSEPGGAAGGPGSQRRLAGGGRRRGERRRKGA